MIDKLGEEPAVLSLLSRAGPEVPPDVSGVPIDEPTQTLPLVAAARPAPPPSVAARAVIVYEPRQRRPWRLWVFTTTLVALTVGVVLGQAVADQPASRSAASTAGTAGTVPPVGAEPAATSSRPVTAPLGTAKTRLLEVTGAATVLTIRSANLGDVLYSITTTGSGAVPKPTNTVRGPRLDLVRTGVLGADIQINAKVSWTIRLVGRSSAQDIDMRAGGLAGVELTGTVVRAELRLPKPKGTVPLQVTGAVTDLAVHAEAGTPVRLRLGAGADSATVDGTTYRTVKAGTAVTSAGWKSAKNRYEIAASAAVSSASVDHR